MTDEEAAVIDTAYAVDRVFFPPAQDTPASAFFVALDALHQAIQRLDQARKATEAGR